MVGRGIALLFHDRGTRRGWVVSSTPRPHYTPGKDPIPILQETGWAPGLVWTGGKSRPHRDSIPDRPVQSQSLYRLCHPAHTQTLYPLQTDNATVSRWSKNSFSVEWHSYAVCIKKQYCKCNSFRKFKKEHFKPAYCLDFAVQIHLFIWGTFFGTFAWHVMWRHRYPFRCSSGDFWVHKPII